MKKAILLFSMPFLFFMTLPAQVTSAEADSIVIERMSGEIKPYTIYAYYSKWAYYLPPESKIITATGDTIELDYPCWVYYVDFANETTAKYLFVKESSGNILELNVINEEVPAYLRWRWRIVATYPLTPFENFSLGGPCQWTLPYNWLGNVIINSEKEFENYMVCHEGTSGIDFSQHTLLLVQNGAAYGIVLIEKYFQQISNTEYNFYVNVTTGDAPVAEYFLESVLVPKLPQNATVNFIINRH